MSYRCELCRATVPHGRPMLRHTETRRVLQSTKQTVNREGRVVAVLLQEPFERTEIARELAVCGSCKWALNEGVPLEKLVRQEPRDGQPALVQTGRLPTKPHRLVGAQNDPSPAMTQHLQTYTERDPEDGGVRCEICNELIGDEGQITAEGVLCARHLRRRV
jgi:hypothetical protein